MHLSAASSSMQRVQMQVLRAGPSAPPHRRENISAYPISSCWLQATSNYKLQAAASKQLAPKINEPPLWVPWPPSKVLGGLALGVLLCPRSRVFGPYRACVGPDGPYSSQTSLGPKRAEVSPKSPETVLNHYRANASRVPWPHPCKGSTKATCKLPL